MPRLRSTPTTDLTLAVEWGILIAMAVLAAAFIAWPRRADTTSYPDASELHAERATLLQELREIEEDLAAGRITTDDRAEARRALGPRLRAVTEALRDLGELNEPRSDRQGDR